MERGDPSLSAQWAAGWEDLVELEIIPVVTAAEAMAALVPRL
jgi:hypothetical protein